MPLPDWKPAYDGSLVVNGVTLNIDSCEYSHDEGTFDATVLPNMPWSDFGNDVTTVTIRGSILVDRNNVQNFATRTDYTCTFTAEQTHSGTIRVNKRSKGLSVRGAYKVSFEGQFRSTVTTT
jgi:hypothetical protein